MDTLFACLKKGTSPESVVDFAKKYLEKEGFEELYYDKLFFPKTGGKYYIAPFPDVFFAFTMGKKRAFIQPVRMAFAHGNPPCFTITGKPERTSVDSSLLHVEVDGDRADCRWFDRPLGISGTVILKGERAFSPESRRYDSQRPLVVIPGRAIRGQEEQNEQKNDRWEKAGSKELVPVAGLAGSAWTEGAFLEFLAGELDVDDSEILSYTLHLYNADAPCLVGLSQEMISSPRLGDLAAVSALLEALVEGERSNGMNLMGIFPGEAAESACGSGADSPLLADLLRGIFTAMDCSEQMFRASMNISNYLSVEGISGARPNDPADEERATRACVGKGPAMQGSRIGYVADPRMQGVLCGLAEKYDLPLQVIHDRKAMTKASAMIGKRLPVRGGALGVPMWALHSARETMALEDYESLCQILTAFFVD